MLPVEQPLHDPDHPPARLLDYIVEPHFSLTLIVLIPTNCSYLESDHRVAGYGGSHPNVKAIAKGLFQFIFLDIVPDCHFFFFSFIVKMCAECADPAASLFMRARAHPPKIIGKAGTAKILVGVE